MGVWEAVRVLFIGSVFVTGLLFALGTLNAKTFGGQATFVAGWTLILLSGLVIVQNY